VNAIKIWDTRKMTEDEWVRARRMGIGGSDVGAICGINDYKSPLAVYMDKVSGGDGFTGNLATEVGTELEGFVRRKTKEWFAEQGIKAAISREHHMLQHPTIPYMLANLDGLIKLPGRGQGVLECKTASEYQSDNWADDKVPDSYYMQCMHYLEVTGLDYCVIACLIGNRQFVVRIIERDERVIARMKEIEREFWEERVVKMNPPDPDGSESSGRALQALYQEDCEKVIDLGDMAQDVAFYHTLGDEIKEREALREGIKQRIQAKMGYASVAMVEGGKITWKTQARKGYVVEPSTTRVLRFSKAKKED